MSSSTHAAGDVTIMSDRPSRSMSGYAVLIGGFVLLVVAAYLGWASFGRSSSSGVLAILIFILGVFVWKGLYVLQPNYSAVLPRTILPDSASSGRRWLLASLCPGPSGTRAPWPS